MPVTGGRGFPAESATHQRECPKSWRSFQARQQIRESTVGEFVDLVLYEFAPNGPPTRGALWTSSTTSLTYSKMMPGR